MWVTGSAHGRGFVPVTCRGRDFVPVPVTATAGENCCPYPCQSGWVSADIRARGNFSLVPNLNQPTTTGQRYFFSHNKVISHQREQAVHQSPIKHTSQKTKKKRKKILNMLLFSLLIRLIAGLT
jgi:hypothetical protein